MTIGIPIEIDESTVVANVEDATEEYNPYVRQNFPNGKRFKQGTKIYQNTGDTIVVTPFDSTATYVDGDMVFGNPYGVEGLGNFISTYIETDGTVPKNPQNYTPIEPDTVGYDSGIDYTRWKYRYTKLADRFSVDKNEILLKIVNTTYTFIDTQDGYVHVYINYGNGQYVQPEPIRAYTRIVTTQLDDPAELVKDGAGNFLYFIPHSIIINETGVYMRTHLDKPVEYTTTTDNIWYFNNTVESIKGFTYMERTNKFKPFDKKAYTSVKSIGTLKYTLKSMGDFNSIVLSGVIAETISIKIGNTLYNRTVDGSIDADAKLLPAPTTEIFYATNRDPDKYTKDDTVDITLFGEKIELGMIMLAQAIDNGFTNLSLKNSYKDFSTFQYDPFGNVDYVERAKVSTYNATVDIKIEDYDRTDRLMKSIGKNVVVIDGADNVALNENGDDNTRIFTSTQKIGRILSYSQKTNVKDSDINKIATYTMTIEEIV